MLTSTHYTVDQKLLQEASMCLPSDAFKMTINAPTGNFFYDPWVIKEEYKETVWNKLISTLPNPIGEARIIILNPATNYQTHADIDDRYHLNISGEQCYLIDMNVEKMYPLAADGIWYSMDASKLHSAINCGRVPRVQLVVRQLLSNAKANTLITVKIHNDTLSKDDARFVFDNKISPWLNKTQKQNKLANFSFKNDLIEFQTTEDVLDELVMSAKDFKVSYDRH